MPLGQGLATLDKTPGQNGRHLWFAVLSPSPQANAGLNCIDWLLEASELAVDCLWGTKSRKYSWLAWVPASGGNRIIGK